MKISGIYRITNTITGDFYIGSSKDVKRRWANHKCPSRLKKCPNNPMYLDMNKYGIDKFAFEILAEVEANKLKEAEQQFIEQLQPTYNNRNANGWDIDRRKEHQKEYRKSDKYKDYRKEYRKSDKYKNYKKEYRKTDKCKEYQKEYNKKYHNQLCFYNGETITLNALRMRFLRKGLSNPTEEAKKYIIKGGK